MTLRPIIFAAPMIRAIIDGRITQTRRIMKPQPPEDCGRLIVGNYHPTLIDRHGEEQPGPETFGAYSEDGAWALRCPYGAPGDSLWVRETCYYNDEIIDVDTGRPMVAYRADGEMPAYMKGERWRPSIHMFRWASRITLEVTGIRVDWERNDWVFVIDFRVMREAHGLPYLRGRVSEP